MEWTALLAEEFPRRDDLIYLNHAGVSPWPRRAAAAVHRFADENLERGPVRYDRWLQTERRLRSRLRALLNAGSEDDIALIKNTSEGLSVVAWGLSWTPGDNVVTSDQEFPSNRIVWESLRRLGVELRQASLDRAETPEDALFACVDERTRLLTISSVQYATGLRMDLARIGRFCRERGVLFCVDAIQSLGALDLDACAIAADFVVADGHKWMLGPEGLGVFYAQEAACDRIELKQYGWHMVEAAGDYERRDWEVARSARRFECGSPNMLGIHALEASLSLIEEIGVSAVAQEILKKTSYLIERIKSYKKLELLSPEHEARRSGIVTFRHRTLPAARLVEILHGRGIHCAVRGGGVRFSPHCYTPQEHLELALRAVEEPG